MNLKSLPCKVAEGFIQKPCNNNNKSVHFYPNNVFKCALCLIKEKKEVIQLIFLFTVISQGACDCEGKGSFDCVTAGEDCRWLLWSSVAIPVQVLMYLAFSLNHTGTHGGLMSLKQTKTGSKL